MRRLLHTLVVGVLGSAGLVGAGLVGTVAAAPVALAAKAPVTVSVTPAEATVLAGPCGRKRLDVTITNPTAEARYVDVYVDAESPVRASRDVLSTYLPANTDVVARVDVSAPSDATPGTYAVQFRVGSRGSPRATVPVTVVPRPTGPDANLALGGAATASSTHGNFSTCGAVDGNANSDDWSTKTGWNDGTSGVFPDWFAVGFEEPMVVRRVELTTLGSSRYPAERYGLRDWDVQVLDGTDWRTVASVRENTVGVVTSTFEPVETTSIRILAIASNDATYSRIVELAAYTNVD